MKNITFLLLLTLCGTFSKTYSQTTQVIAGLTDPLVMGISGNYIYFVNQDKIQKIDATLASPTAVTVVSGLTSPQYLAIQGNYLYIAHGHKVSRINITVTTPTTFTDVLTTPSTFTSAIAISGNTLYVSFTNHKIGKIDLTQANPVLVDVIDTGMSSLLSMLMVGNDLYFTSTITTGYPAQGLSKIDLTQASPTITPVLGGLDDPKQLLMNGNSMLITELGGNTISAIDITQANPVKTQVLALDGPYGIAIRNGILFVSELFDMKIVKTNNTLSINEVSQPVSEIQLYPNPAQDEINISGLEPNEDITLYNQMGQILQQGHIENNKIAVSNLAKGVYFVKTANRPALKFIKE